MEKVPYIRQRKQSPGLISDNTSLANFTISESILNDTPYPDIGSLGLARKLTPEQVEKQRARGALRDHERADKARDRLKNASQTEQGSIISSSSSSGQTVQDSRLQNQNVIIGPQQQQQAPRYHPRPGLPFYCAHFSRDRLPYIPTETTTITATTITATTAPSIPPPHLHAWQLYQSNAASSDPLPPGMSSLPQSLLVFNTRPMVQPGLPNVTPSWRPRQYNATSSTVQLPVNALPAGSQHFGNVVHDGVQQGMQNHVQGVAVFFYH